MVGYDRDFGAMMTVEKVTKDISAFVITPRLQKTSLWKATDGTTFDLKKDADRHDKKVIALEEFFTHFSAEKGNLKLGDGLLNKILCPFPHEKNYTFEDCFWLKFDSLDKDEKILRKFCVSFYRTSLGDELTSEDKFPMEGWVYIMVINTNSQSSNRWYWVSLETLRKRIRIMENCFPDNGKSLTPLGSEGSLLDLD